VPAGEHAVTVTAFRQVMSRLAGGVTVVATVDDDGAAHGMTVNALTSVSLDPVLVLFCCERDASLHAPLLSSGRWTVSMLTAQQEPLSRWFAARERRGTAQFAGLATRPGAHTGVPILTESLAWLECRTWATYDGGDHTIVVGNVVNLGRGTSDASPLLYYGGEYRTLG
jgi:flavin reductase (DIM6/NTAB) family NADH-FMN oxidoreductase RutF